MSIDIFVIQKRNHELRYAFIIIRIKYVWAFFDPDLDSLFLNFTSYSQGAYEYFESYESQDNRGFLGPFGGEPIPVYSNVQNGLGILASYNMQSDLLLP